MPELKAGDRDFMRSLPRTVFNFAADAGVTERQFRERLARPQRAGLVRVRLDEALAAGRPAMALVTLTEGGRSAIYGASLGVPS